MGMAKEFRFHFDPRDKIIREQAARIEFLEDKVEKLESQVKRLLELLEGKAKSKAAKKPVFAENYSLERNQKKKVKQTKQPRKLAGRKPTKTKRNQSTKKVEIYPENVSHAKCTLHRSQFVWRMIDGHAIYVQYDIYDLPSSKNLPLPAGVRTNRSEFGIEIILTSACLHYWIGISLDNVCAVMNFFTGLELPKSQAESLLKQLAGDWDKQYETIAELIALQLVVYIDETGWQIGKKSCYTWVFSTSMYVLFRCGVSRKQSEATAVLG